MGKGEKAESRERTSTAECTFIYLFFWQGSDTGIWGLRDWCRTNRWHEVIGRERGCEATADGGRKKKLNLNGMKFIKKEFQENQVLGQADI